MSAWDRQVFQFNNSIQSRGGAYSGVIPFNSAKGRSISRDDYTIPSPSPLSTGAPSFTEATSQWSPPPSPRTRSLRYDSPRTSRSSSGNTSPQVDTPITMDSPTSPLTPKSVPELRSLADKLYAAACAGDIKHVRLLLSLGAPINTPSLVPDLYDAFKPPKPGPLSSLAGAAGNGHLAIVRLLLSHGAALNPSMKESSSSPLHQACKADDVEMAAFLLEAGADVDLLNCFNTTPVMYSGKYGSPALMRVLLEYNPDLHRLSFIRSAAIHWTLWAGNVDSLALLLEAGADPDQLMGDGGTALHCAATSNLAGVAKVLLRHGADWTKKNEEWKTPLQIAAELGHWEVAGVLEQAAENRRK
ncbi:uncharacterized protein LTR77_001492 [Saxophila tyrrhenica]|uniref:Ankyrin n=1 Tax=Saxophila tyrrhenica TaxID=1690608 RepID=A0AAV9PQ22_9PEZI|nr:hypothetical protein LTR77_001492 [Saxophila tyrrhenica]